jgi:hypothetical protein
MWVKLVLSRDNIADLFTKPLSTDVHELLSSLASNKQERDTDWYH